MKPASNRIIFVLALLFVGVTSHSSAVLAQSSGTFTATGDMTAARGRPLATLLANGKVLIVGGEEGSRTPYPVDITAELYDQATGKFAAIGTIAGVGPFLSSVTLLPDGRVLIVGF